MFFGRSDHCHQWFYDGFLMLLPSLSMVFDGFGPLVKRCDGFDGSLWSTESFDHPFILFPQSRTAVHFQGLLDLSKDSFENGESEPQHRRGGSFGSGS